MHSFCLKSSLFLAPSLPIHLHLSLSLSLSSLQMMFWRKQSPSIDTQYIARERFYCLFILCFLCISLHLLILQVMSDDADTLVADICNSTPPSLNCTALGNTPFISEALCQSFESFLKSNCSSGKVAYWNAFQNAISGTTKLHGLPALTGIYSLGNYITYITLAWDTTVVGRKACDMP